MTILPAGTYDNPYFHDNVHGHAVELLRRQENATNRTGIHLDIGCGYARIAEPLTKSLGLHYVGIDDFDAAIKSGQERGLEIHKLHLSDGETTYTTLKNIVGNRHLHSISMLDALEHLQDGNETLKAIQKLASEYTAFIVISVPNITHTDIGLKLALGKWNYTEVGLLDHTHVRLFSREYLIKVLRKCGLHLIDSYDVRKNISDQHFPEDHPILASGTLLHKFMKNLRQNVDNDGNVYQFVQLCVAGPQIKQEPYRLTPEKRRPFLSIVTRTQGTRIHTLREVLTSLSAQTETDFEVLILAHRITAKRQKIVERLIEDTPQWLRAKIRIILVDDGNRTRPLNDGFGAAQGHYISILDDDDMPMADWIETFKELATANPGCMIRTVAVRQNVKSITVNNEPGLRAEGPLEMRYSKNFDYIEHLRTNQTPPIAVAFPSGVFHELNIHFDETLTTTEDWDYIMRVAGIVGVISSEKITAIYRWWEKDHSSRTEHSSEEWKNNHQKILSKIDNSLVLLPTNTTGRIRTLLDENDQLRSILQKNNIKYYSNNAIAADQDGLRATLQQKIIEITKSNSWNLAAPLRILGYLLGKPKMRLEIIPQMQPHELQALHDALTTSRSWRLTKPLRELRKNLK